MKYQDRYSSAVRSSNLKQSSEATVDTDILGAAGFAAKHSPLAMALLRLFVGDNHAARDVVLIMADKAVGKAWHWGQIELSRVEAEGMACKVLAWHRDGVCKPCGGHGVKLQSGGRIGDGRDALSDRQCPECRGTRKVPFEREFSGERLPLRDGCAMKWSARRRRQGLRLWLRWRRGWTCETARQLAYNPPPSRIRDQTAHKGVSNSRARHCAGFVLPEAEPTCGDCPALNCRTGHQGHGGRSPGALTNAAPTS